MNFLHGLIDPPEGENSKDENPEEELERCFHCDDKFIPNELFTLEVDSLEKVCSKCLNDFHQIQNI